MRLDRPWDGGELPASGAARGRFELWLERAAVGGLLNASADRAWRDTELEPVSRENRAGKVVTYRMKMLYRLDRADIARVKAAAVRAIEAAGGRAELGATVATVEGGELRIAMA